MDGEHPVVCSRCTHSARSPAPGTCPAMSVRSEHTFTSPITSSNPRPASSNSPRSACPARGPALAHADVGGVLARADSPRAAAPRARGPAEAGSPHSPRHLSAHPRRARAKRRPSAPFSRHDCSSSSLAKDSSRGLSSSPRSIRLASESGARRSACASLRPDHAAAEDRPAHRDLLRRRRLAVWLRAPRRAASRLDQRPHGRACSRHDDRPSGPRACRSPRAAFATPSNRPTPRTTSGHSSSSHERPCSASFELMSMISSQRLGASVHVEGAGQRLASTPGIRRRPRRAADRGAAEPSRACTRGRSARHRSNPARRSATFPPLLRRDGRRPPRPTVPHPGPPHQRRTG